jgi:hypothetical protein
MSSPEPGLSDLERDVAAHIEGGAVADALHIVHEALLAHPSDPDLLLLAALAAALGDQPDVSLRYQRRFSKRFVAFEQEINILRAIALAQQGHWYQAQRVLEQNGIKLGHYLGIGYLPCSYSVIPSLRRWLTRIEREN